MSVTIHHGSALALPLPDDSVDLVVTSPPYFGLRSYVDDGNPMTHQVGAEATPEQYVDALIAATRECMRVLKNSGSLWVNLGDKYSSGTGTRNVGLNERTGRASGRRVQDRSGVQQTPVAGFPPKSLLGLPWRYALRCIDELGLILRAEVVWSKPNGLPESVRDRVRRSHEQWFHFTLRPNYYANVDEVREEYAPATASRNAYARPISGPSRAAGANVEDRPAGTAGNPLGKLPGSVWTIATQPLRVPAELGIDHFAAFPMEWPRRIITGWSPPGVCTACGEGRRAAAEPTGRTVASDGRDQFGAYAERRGRGETTGPQRQSGSGTASMPRRERVLTGYACACPTPDAPTCPAVVLDPFGGTGTTALVADVLGRDGVSVDLSADYCRLAQWRTADPKERARVLKTREPMRHTAAARAGNPPERNTMPSKMSDDRLRTSYTRAIAERGRIDTRVAKARKTLDELEDTRAKAQATIDNAESDRAEVDAQLTHLRTIAKNRGVNLDAATAGTPENVEDNDDEGTDEEPEVQNDGEPVAQAAPGTPAFSQGY